MKIEITKDKWDIMQEFFKLHSIKVDINSVITDEALVKLCFVEKVPCIVELGYFGRRYRQNMGNL